MALPHRPPKSRIPSVEMEGHTVCREVSTEQDFWKVSQEARHEANLPSSRIVRVQTDPALEQSPSFAYMGMMGIFYILMGSYTGVCICQTLKVYTDDLHISLCVNSLSREKNLSTH